MKVNWKCAECGLVCGTQQGIRSHWERKQEKGDGHKATYVASSSRFVLETSEPVTNPAWYVGKRKTGNKKKKKKVDKYNDVKMERLMETAIREERGDMDAMLIITPLIIKGTQVIQSVDVRIIQEGELIC